ncbi:MULTISPECIES: HNH endonuclease [Nostocales]|uniref:HNH endonuclease n=4 Tax=Nostocales TaxID=1161 RepID=A0A8S9T1X6_9CYAN|nr:HNH endonuclease signature motif containing protein [Tolypothrix bouteillei]KAF3885694.1 HNH endonuclease [Tolypothrix bouteillei VB521301]
MAIPDKIRSEVLARAGFRCEYCKTYSRLVGMPLVMEHILPKAAGGKDESDNLAASCYRCNEFKGAKTHAIDPQTSQLVPLFNPRQQFWQEHFSWVNGGTHIAGLTPTGRATVIALRLNNEYITEARVLWIESNWHPPSR